VMESPMKTTVSLGPMRRLGLTGVGPGVGVRVKAHAWETRTKIPQKSGLNAEGKDALVRNGMVRTPGQDRTMVGIPGHFSGLAAQGLRKASTLILSRAEAVDKP